VDLGKLTGNDPIFLQYQVVDPGAYIDLKDPIFQTKWLSAAMNDEGRDGDANSQDGVFSTKLPKEVQMHRRLVRYRIAAGNVVITPAQDSGSPNFAYFVYDGVPAWKGAVNPKSENPKLRQPVSFGTNVMRSLPVYHLISKKSSIENVTWYEQAPWGDTVARKTYNYTGTFVADDGKVYDHVRFRARGGQWRYSMGKNMWKLDFPRGHHLQARDNYGQIYKTKWEKLNLGACIQQASSRHRGEHGMFEAVGFKLFNLAGVEAPRTHWVHFRIVKEAEEAPADQYEGDFWGLYLATEDMDDAFLKEHDLPAGALYKLEFGQPRLHTEAQNRHQDDNDVRQFIAGIRRGKDEQWWRQNLDLPRYYSYRSILECIHHYDIYAGKNYFYYHNPQSRLWSVLPWDIDLSWADNMHGNGQEPFYQAGLLSRPPFRIEYQNRLREIRDLLFNPEQTDALIDEYAAFISSSVGDSFVDADRAKWDYHPIMASRYVTSKARQGEFYKISPTGDFRGMVQLMKDYVRRRGQWVDETLLGDQTLPPTPTVQIDGKLHFSSKEMSFRASLPPNGAAAPRWLWRLAEVTVDPASAIRAPRKYEIRAIWQSDGEAIARVPTGLLEPGRTYRVRVRVQDATGRRSHWSAPVQFTVPQL
jgi:hypothetical protein